MGRSNLASCDKVMKVFPENMLKLRGRGGKKKEQIFKHANPLSLFSCINEKLSWKQGADLGLDVGAGAVTWQFLKK